MTETVHDELLRISDELDRNGHYGASQAMVRGAREINRLDGELAAEKGLVHYYRTLAQLYAAPPHDVAAQMKIITGRCDIDNDAFEEQRKLGLEHETND